MHYWLMKSEACFTIEALAKCPKQTTHWDGVRNYQARNMLRDEMQVGDEVFFYRSNGDPSGITGIAKIVKAGYPDFTAFDPSDDHFDPKSDPKNPMWYMVDIQLKTIFPRILSLAELRNHLELAEMQLLKKGNRLSVMPVAKKEWDFIQTLVT